MSKRTWREMSEVGYTERISIKKKAGGGKRKRPKFRTKEDAEKDRKFRTGVRSSKKGGGWN